MTKDFVLVFDIGSSRLRALVAGEGVNNTLMIKSQAEKEYAGFYEGRLLDRDGLINDFKEVLDNLDYSSFKNLKKVYIGVPAEFSSVTTTNASLNFGDRKKIKKIDIEQLYYSASEKAKNETAEILTICPISFKLDDGRFCRNPEGEVASILSGQLSVIFASRAFISTLNDVVATLGFENVEYLSESLCEGLFCISEEGRDDLNLIINIGDLTTNVALVRGRGLVSLASFSIGGGHITNDLSQAFELSLSEADKLKRQIVLSLEGKKGDNYDLMRDSSAGTPSRITKIDLNGANEVVKYRIEMIANAITQCIQLFSQEYIAYLPTHLSGAGVSQIKGGRDYLAKCLGRNIAYLCPPLPGKNNPKLASLYSLAKEALRVSGEAK